MLNDKKADDFNAKCERSIIKILRLLVDKCIIIIGNFYGYHVQQFFKQNYFESCIKCVPSSQVQH